MVLFCISSYANVFRDQRKPVQIETDNYYLVMARNEYQSYQICLRHSDSFTINSVVFQDLASPEGTTIKAENIEYGYVEYVYIPKVTTWMTEADAIRKPPEWFPDPISNCRSMRVEGKTTQPIWITAYIPKGTKSGKYTGKVTINTTYGEMTSMLTVEVCAVTIPDTDKAEMKYMHHQQTVGPWWMYSRKGYYPNDPIKVCYGYDRYTPEWWALVGDIADKMRTHRQNILYINTQSLLLDGGTTVDDTGRFTFNWSRFDEYIEFHINKGVVKGLEGTHLSTVNYLDFTFETYLLKKGEHGMELGASKYNTAESKNWLEQYLPALVNHIDEKGWTDIWYQHIGDEAMNEEAMKQYLFYLDLLKEYNPKFIIGDPVCGGAYAKRMVDYGCDVSVPLENVFQIDRPIFDDMINNGVNVYVYNCCAPGGKWLSRFIDSPVWHMRSLAWLMYNWNVKGFLHWGFNFWIDWTDPTYLEISEEEVRGDHYTIYPDWCYPTKVRSSIRYEANRDAAQDFELLQILGAYEPEIAKNLVDSVVKNADSDFSTDIYHMRRQRDELVRAAGRVANEE